MKARLVKRAVVAVVAILVVLLVVFFVLRALFPPDVLTELAVSRLEEATGLEISVKHAAISFVHWRIGVKVSDIEVSRLEEDEYVRLAQVPEMGVVVALTPLFRRQILAETVYIERPHVSLRLGERLAAGTDTARAVSGKPGSDETRPAPLLLSLSVPKAIVRGGTLRIEDPASGTVIGVSHLDGTSSLRGEKGSDVLLSEGKFSCRDVSLLAGDKMPFAIPAQKVDGSWKITVNPGARAVDVTNVSLNVSELPVEISGKVVLAGEEPDVRLHVTLDGAPLQGLLAFVPVEMLEKVPESKLAGELIASVDVEGRPASPDYRGTFELVGGKGSLLGVSLSEMSARGRFDRETISVENFIVALDGSVVRGNIAINTAPPRGATFETSGELDLNEISVLLPLPEGPKVVGGEVSFDARGEGPIDELAADPLSVRLRGEASVRDIEVELPAPSPPVLIESARLAFSGRRADISEAVARIGNSEFHLEGTLHDWKERSLDVEVSSPSVDLKEFLGPLAKGPVLKAEGATSPGIPALALTGVPVSGSASLKVEELHYDDFAAEELSAELSFGPDSLALNEVNMRTLGGVCRGKGKVLLAKDEAPRYRGTFSANRIELSEVLDSFTPIKGLFKGQTFLEIAAEGDLREDFSPLASLIAAGNVRTAKASAVASPLVSTIAAWTNLERKEEYPLQDFATSFLVENGRLIVPRCRLAGENSAWEFSGSTGFDGTLDHRVNVVFSKEYSEKLGSLKGLQRLIKDNEGRVVLDLVVGGTVKKPSIKWDRTRMEERAKQYLAEKLRLQLEKGGEKTEELKEDLGGNLEEKVEQLKKEAAEKGKKLLEELFKKKEKKKD